MAFMSTDYKFNTAPADSDDTCEVCGSADGILICDSDWGPLTVALCADHIDADYDPEAD